MGRDCFRFLRNHEITDENCKDPAKCRKALESYFKPGLGSSTWNQVQVQVL